MLNNPSIVFNITIGNTEASLDVTLFFALLRNIQRNEYGGLVLDPTNPYGYAFIEPIENILNGTGTDTTNYLVDSDNELLLDNDNMQLVDGQTTTTTNVVDSDSTLLVDNDNVQLID